MHTIPLFFAFVSCTPAPAKVGYTDASGAAAADAADNGADNSPNPSEPDSDGTADPDPEPDSESEAETGPDDPEEGGNAPHEDGDEAGLAEWTIMVYLAADNNLESAALTDLNEMETAGSTDAVNILVELDRAEGYSDADGDWTGARRYRVERDTNPNVITTPVAVDLGEVDSGDPQTFIDFIEWGVEHYPAKRTAFIIWNHGWGWTLVPQSGRKGVASDDQSGNDISIANGEYEQILRAGVSALGERFSLVGMDACLMANWETARVTAPYGEVYVASQATESLDGWAFHTALQDLIDDPEMDADELGVVFAERFHETDDSTLSVTDLDELVAMDGAIESFALAVLADDNPRGEVRRQARRAQNFDGDPSDRDLGDFMVRMADASSNEDIVAAAENVRDEIDSTIVANFINGGWVSDATGLSIYLPVNGADAEYRAGSWNDLTEWTAMLDAVAD
ncbi:MAG: clostripain-related cysteine peptidase [Myxococcota bacterium]|nr:clostripain-related cysteine peptidase [Myxococcota bacterium]